MSEPPNTPLEYAPPPPGLRRRVGVLVALLMLAFLLGVAVPVLLFTVRNTYTAVSTVSIVPASPTVITDLPTITRQPERVTIVQRGREVLPGTDGNVVARIGDITGGQTLLTVEDAQGGRIVNTVSVREGDVHQFSAGGAAYEVELIELKNFLTGDDFAVFEVRRRGATTAATTSPALSEAEKIERLIAAVASARDMRFIRNGKAHSAADAADHLRRKYESARDRNLTARQFIEHIASKSSISGKPYRVRLRDGSEQASAEWLSARLSEIESPAPATPGGNASTRPS